MDMNGKSHILIVFVVSRLEETLPPNPTLNFPMPMPTPSFPRPAVVRTFGRFDDTPSTKKTCLIYKKAIRRKGPRCDRSVSSADHCETHPQNIFLCVDQGARRSICFLGDGHETWFACVDAHSSERAPVVDHQL